MMSLIMNANIRISLLCLLFVGAFCERNLKDYGTSFSCGKLFYRSLFFNIKRGQILVGAMDRVFRLNMENINHTSCENGTDVLHLTSKDVKKCTDKGLSKDYHCHNHIRIMQVLPKAHIAYFCGTNAYDPVAFSIELPSELRTPLKDMPFKYIPFRGGTGRCPFNPDANYTSLEIDGTAIVGSGVDVNDSYITIAQHKLNAASEEEAKSYYVRTNYKDPKYLNKPQFVSSFPEYDNKHLYIIFREHAYLDSKPGTHISRIGAVCLNDKGMNRDGYKTWQYYAKAPFVCETAKTKYNVVVDALILVNHFYKYISGLFTTENFQEFALCEYAEDTFRYRVFKGPFAKDFSGRHADKVETDSVPEPHPFDCNANGPSPSTNFSFHHPLMHNSYVMKPYYESKTDHYTKYVFIASHMTSGRGFSHFAGTYEGEIHQFVYFMKNDIWFYVILDIIEIEPREPIRAIVYSEEKRYLYASSDSAVHQFDLSQCEKRFKYCLECTRDRLCSWDPVNKKCIYGRNGLYEDRQSYFTSMCEKYVHTHQDTITFGHQNRIKCKSIFVREDSLSSFKDNVAWIRCESGETVINCIDNEKYTCTNQVLTIKSTSYEDAGCYKCRLISTTLYSVNMAVVDIKTESFVSVSGETLQVMCQNSEIQKKNILSSDISWQKCHHSEKDNKTEDTSNKYTFENYTLFFSPVSEKDEGCHTCETDTKVLYTFHLKVITPKNYLVTDGSKARLSCKRTSHHQASYFSSDIEWLKTNDQQSFAKIEEKADKYIFENDILIIKSVKNEDAGYYNCKINGIYENSYDLKIVDIIPELYVVSYGGTAKLECNTTAKHEIDKPSNETQWLKSSDAKNFTTIEAKENKYVFQTRSLSIKLVDNHDEAYYKCKISDTNIYSYDVRVVTAHSITPLTLVNFGQPAALVCNNPLFKKVDIPSSKIKWYRCENKKNITLIETGTPEYSTKENKLIISLAYDEDEGCYSCYLDEVKLLDFKLIVLNATSKSFDVDLYRKTTIVCANLMMHKANIPSKLIKWYRCDNEKNITKLTIDGTKYMFKNYSLVIPFVNKSDLGCYSCKYEDVLLHTAEIKMKKDITPTRDACGIKCYMLWKYIFFVHVFVMVMKNIGLF